MKYISRETKSRCQQCIDACNKCIVACEDIIRSCTKTGATCTFNISSHLKDIHNCIEACKSSSNEFAKSAELSKHQAEQDLLTDCQQKCHEAIKMAGEAERLCKVEPIRCQKACDDLIEKLDECIEVCQKLIN